MVLAGTWVCDTVPAPHNLWGLCAVDQAATCRGYLLLHSYCVDGDRRRQRASFRLKSLSGGFVAAGFPSLHTAEGIEAALDSSNSVIRHAGSSA